MDEQEPVDDDEFVYRRIHPRFYTSSFPVAVFYEAFRTPIAEAAPGLSDS
jgi:hypothetical protein